MIFAPARAHERPEQWIRHAPPIVMAFCDLCAVRLGDAGPIAPGELARFLREHVHEPTIQADGRFVPAVLLRTGDAMHDDAGELTWCDDCGRLVPYRHRHNPTIRALVANRILRVLFRVRLAVEHFRDMGKPYP